VGRNGCESDTIAHADVEAAVRALAGRQSGNVERRQLLALGLGSGAIKARVANGSFVVRYRGVYAIAPARQDPQAVIAAAVLAGGPTAVASHASAGWLWGFVGHYAPPPEVSLPTGDRRPRHIRTHRCPSLQPRDVTRQRGIPTTTPARTALDLAPRLAQKRLTRLVNDALREKDLRPAALEDVLERNPRHPGTRLLIPFLETASSPSDSPFEDDFRAFCTRYGLPRPEINFPLNGRRLDVFFPEYGVIVECDGWDFHKDRQAFEDDRERDADHLDLGLVTLRLTRPRFQGTPDREAARLLRILDSRDRWTPPAEAT
jgi:hypothetical protein